MLFFDQKLMQQFLSICWGIILFSHGSRSMFFNVVEILYINTGMTFSTSPVGFASFSQKLSWFQRKNPSLHAEAMYPISFILKGLCVILILFSNLLKNHGSFNF